MKKFTSITLFCFVLGKSALIWADETYDFKINGFMSATTAWSSVDYLTSGVEPVYISYIHKRPSFDRDSNVGIQISKYIGENVSLTTQLYAAAADSFDVEATWAFLKWEPNDRWQFRVGRIRTPTYMLSEYVEVSYSYPWVRPPVEVYSQVPFSNSTGVDARYHQVICEQDLFISAFYGATTDRIRALSTIPNGAVYEDFKLWLRPLGAIDIRYGNEVFMMRAGYEFARMSLYPASGTLISGINDFINSLVVANVIGGDYTNYFAITDRRASFAGIGYQFDWHDVVSMGEIVQRRTDAPNIANAVGWYVMGGYRIKQLLPHVTFARERVMGNKARRFSGLVNALASAPPPAGLGMSLDDIAQQLISTSENYDGGVGDQTSVTLGLRWDVYTGVALKAEFQHVHPDHNSPGLFNIYPHKSVNIYSLGLNAVM